MIDAKDREILTILQGNARISNAEIARQVGISPSAILERIRRMEASGVIQGYETRVAPEALGYHLLAFVFVATNDFSGELKIAERLSGTPGVQEVHHIAGEDCFLVKVRARDARSLGRLLREELGQLRTRTTVVLETICESTRLPLDGTTPADSGGVP